MMRVFVCLALMMGFVAATLSPAVADRPAMERARLDDPAMEISWRDTWGETYELNRQRFDEQVSDATDDARTAQTRLERRLVYLVERMIDRFDPVGDERLAAYETLVEHLHRGALHHPELDYLKRIATEFPGRVDAATEALSTLLSRAGAMADTVEGARHHRDAAERLLALGRAGHLPPGDPLMARAHRALGEAYRDEGRYFEAAAAFAAALAAGEDALDVALAEAAMLADLGRLTDAAARYDALLQGHPTESDAGRAITARLQRVEARRERYTFAPSFPQEAGLGGRWDALRRRGDDAGLADEIQRLLERDVAGQNVVSQRERVRQSIWRSIEALVLERPGLREALAAAQQERAERALADAAGDEAATLAAARRYPWANATQAALLELGERALWDGRLGAVERHLDDVLRRAGDAAQRETAERGLAMVRRHAQLPHAGPEPSLGSLAYLGVPVDAPLWPTGFLNRVPAAALDPLVPLPLAIVTSDDAAHTAVAGPGGLAVYGPGDTTPRWARVAGWTSGMSRGSSIRREITIPAPMRPAIDGGRVYTLWGLDTSRRHPAGLAAFDIRTGEMIWSTDGDDALVDAQLVGDPAVADGFVYCLAVRQGLITPIELVALDAATGELRWRRRLATQTPELAGPDSGPLSDREIDLVRYGSGVRVAGGYVYANTNMGLVARLDARDGVIDWIHQYPRLHLDDQWRQTVRRRGGAPVVVRDTLVVTPRDSSGAIALDGQTGAIVWDAPLIPGEQMLGVVRDAVLLAEGHVLVSVAVTSGEVRWRRSFDAPIRAEPVLAGDELLVAAGDRLHRFDARTGGRIEEAPLDREPTALRALGVRGGQVVAISDEPAAAPAEADAPTAEPAVVPPGRWFDADEDRRLESLPTFPLTRLGLLARAEAELLVPDAEAAMGDDLVLHSPGLIERIDPRDPTAPRWQRTVTRTVREVAWAPGLILLIGDDSIHSLDAATGRTAWRYDPAMPINRWRAFDDQFVLLNESGTSGPPRLAAIDRATGRELWTRDLSRDFGSFRVRELLADEGTLHLLGYFVRGRKAALKFDLADGAYTGEGPYLGDPDDVARPSRTIKVVGRVFYYTGEDRRLYRWELGSIDGPERFEPTLSGAFRYGAAMRVHVDGPWIQVRQYNRDGTPDYEHWTFHRDDPDTMIHRDRPGLIHEARIYEMHGSHVGAYNLRTGERVATYRLPPVEHAWAPRGLGNWIAGLPGWLHGRYSLRFSPGARAAWIDDGHMLVATGFGGPGWPHPADRLRLDRFDLDTGERVGRQMLPMTHDAFTQLVYRGGHLLVTDRDGLHAFAPATALTTPPLSAAEGGGAAPTAPGSRAWLAHHLSEAPDFRGASPAAWGATPYTLTDAAGRDARLVLGHDDEWLYVALTHRADAWRPVRGHAALAGGHRLEVAMRLSNRRDYRFAIGVDARGRVVHDAIDGSNADRVEAAVSFDPAAGELTYRLKIPAETYGDRRYNNWRQLSLALVAWAEPVDGQRERVVSFGGAALTGQHHPGVGFEELYLHDRSLAAEQALLDLAHELPDLPIAWQTLQGATRVRQSMVSTEPAGLLRDFVRANPDRAYTGDALARLDQFLRQTGTRNPVDQVASFAVQVGVPEPVIERYRRQAVAELRHHVYADEGDDAPSTAYLGLLRPGDSSPVRAMFWGSPQGDMGSHYTTPRARFGGTEPIGGTWTELRTPLIALDMHDTAIAGVRFESYGGTTRWGATRLALADDESTLIHDATPDGDTHGTWRWHDAPATSVTATRVHTAGDGDDNQRHGITAFAQPVTAHLVPPAAGPMLTVWVRLADDAPPHTLALQLYDGSTWRRATWGRVVDENARHVGELPNAGTWHELRVPLAWVDAAGLPIYRIAVGAAGGSAHWQGVAIELPGGERLQLIDTAETTAGETSSDWQWGGTPARPGPGAPFTGPASGDLATLVLTLDAPVMGHLRDDPARVIDTIKAHLPRLGDDEAAWPLLQLARRFTDGSDEARYALDLAFAAALPAHERTPGLVEGVVEGRLDAGEAAGDVLDDIDAMLNLDGALRYRLRREHIEHQPAYLTRFRAIGPFTDDDVDDAIAIEAPPERAVRLGDRHGWLRWREHRERDTPVDLARTVEVDDEGVAYAVTWVRSDDWRPAIIELGAGGAAQVRLNGRLVLDADEAGRASPGRDTARVSLAPGWNELLIKLAGPAPDRWRFYVELVDPDTGAPLELEQRDDAPADG